MRGFLRTRALKARKRSRKAGQVREKPLHGRLSFEELLESLRKAVSYQGLGSRHRRISLACSELYRSIEMMTHADPKSEKLVGAVLSYRIALSAISPKELTRSERAVVALHLGRANGMMLDLGLARPAKAKTIRNAINAVSRLVTDRGKYSELEAELENLVSLTAREARGLYLKNPSSKKFTAPLKRTRKFIGRVSGSGAFAASGKLFSLVERESGVLSKLSDPSVLKESIDSIREADGIVRKAKTLSELREAESIVRGLRCASKIDGGLEKRMISNIERKRKDISARILQVAQGQKRFPPKLPGEKIGRAEPVFEERKIRGLQESIARSLIRICGEAETLSGLREAEAMARGFHYDGRIDDAAAEKIISAIEAKRRTISSKITGNSS